jgi:hypothetical protein
MRESPRPEEGPSARFDNMAAMRDSRGVLHVLLDEQHRRASRVDFAYDPEQSLVD